MRELPPLQNSEQSFRSVMLRMTGPALSPRVDLHHSAVNGNRIEHLQSHIHVTGGTTVIHGDPTPGCHVAGPTIPADIGMGGNPVQDCAGICVKSARAKHGPTARESRDRGQHCHDHCGYDRFF